MSTLALDVRNFILDRLGKMPTDELLDFARTGVADVTAVAPISPQPFPLNGFVKIDARGEELPDSANDWVAVKDLSTHLIWSRETVDFDKRYEWADAKRVASEVNLCGWNDWRLPTRAELLSLVDDTRHSPAINTDYFNCHSSWYWTSTPLASSPGGCAWVVVFGSGLASWNDQSASGLVRAVRASQ